MSVARSGFLGTLWYKNVPKNPSMRIGARRAKAEFPAVPITKAKAVKSFVGRFHEKYGAGT